MDNRAMEKHTDLAIEVRESFPEDSVEIDGVCLEKHTLAGGELLVTRVIIKDQHGAEQMGKPVGDYFTLEFQSLEAQETIQKEIYKILDCLLAGERSFISVSDRFRKSFRNSGCTRPLCCRTHSSKSSSGNRPCCYVQCSDSRGYGTDRN